MRINRELLKPGAISDQLNQIPRGEAQEISVYGYTHTQPPADSVQTGLKSSQGVTLKLYLFE